MDKTCNGIIERIISHPAVAQIPTDLSMACSFLMTSREPVIYYLKPLRVVSSKRLSGNTSTTGILVACALFQTYFIRDKDAGPSI